MFLYSKLYIKQFYEERKYYIDFYVHLSISKEFTSTNEIASSSQILFCLEWQEEYNAAERAYHLKNYCDCACLDQTITEGINEN